MSVDLNIIERGLNGQAWTAEKGAITSGDLAQISEQRTNSSSALNALPTPFARFFVVKEAFRRALDEKRDPNKIAGDAYNRLVSDTLDVFELLYNLTFHQKRWDKEGLQLDIVEWNYDAQLPGLKKGVPILAKALQNYFPSDLKAANGKLFFIVLTQGGREYLLATSSPYTGFVTPPDLDKKVDSTGKKDDRFLGTRYESLPVVKRKNGGCYFRDIRLFGQRDREFKNYMAHLVNNDNLGPEMRELRDYVKQFQVDDNDIVNDWQPQLNPIYSSDSTPLGVNGLEVGKDAGLSTVNFFTDTLIRLPFRLSKAYRSMTFANDTEERDFDFLLPINREALDVMEGDFSCSCKLGRMKVTVTLNYRGATYTKDYSNDGVGSEGRIVNLLKHENIDFNLAVFPNILSPNPAENTYFKVMAVVSDATTDYRPFSIDKLDIEFFFKEEGRFHPIETIGADNTHAGFGVRPSVVRSKQDASSEIGASSKFYEVFNRQFDALNIRMALDSGVAEGLLLPDWKVAQRTEHKYTYAVDLGTTNTYISCAKIGEANEPEQLSMSEPMVAFLHNSRKSAQQPLAKVIEDGIAGNSRKNFSTEFLPALIDGRLHRFPIRTAMCVPKGDNSKASLFDNCNIAFFYERMTGQGNQTILTDIKWEGKHERELRMFIRELLLIVKTDVLQKNGQLSGTNIIWFRPLSFKASVAALYNKIWAEEAKTLLNIPPSQIDVVSESEAPYYYFRKMNAFQSIDAVSIVDIGGGSTDFIYFADGKPQIANSVHFGCDVLWGNGFNEFENAKTNGIYRKFAETIHFEDEELEKLNVQMRMSKETTTKDIINFWLSHDDKCEIGKKLQASFKPLFLYHFASIVYFMARMYRARNLACPRSVLFCGNGSRYIDGLLSPNKKTIEELVTKIFASVYGDGIRAVQVILPEVRKESTCYGGLYRRSDVEVPPEFNFQGVDGTEFEDVAALKEAFPKLEPSLLLSLGAFNALYRKLLHILIRSGELENFNSTEEILETVSANLGDSLTRNFKTQVVEALNDNEVYHDSLFFLPIIDNVFNLTDI